MNEAREPVMRWHFENAWINKIEGPAFKASGNEVAIESVELVHEGLTLENWRREAPHHGHLRNTRRLYRARRPRAGGISRLRTDVAGFVGIAERGPARRAVAVESWKQFQAVFGGLFGTAISPMWCAAFFENGGRRCWVVRVEGEAAQIARRVVRRRRRRAPRSGASRRIRAAHGATG